MSKQQNTEHATTNSERPRDLAQISKTLQQTKTNHGTRTTRYAAGDKKPSEYSGHTKQHTPTATHIQRGAGVVQKFRERFQRLRQRTADEQRGCETTTSIVPQRISERCVRLPTDKQPSKPRRHLQRAANSHLHSGKETGRPSCIQSSTTRQQISPTVRHVAERSGTESLSRREPGYNSADVTANISGRSQPISATGSLPGKTDNIRTSQSSSTSRGDTVQTEANGFVSSDYPSHRRSDSTSERY